nr:DsbA family protein [Motilibacter aurantiacus]
MQVWSDVACPWAALAVVRLRAARERLGLELDVRVDHRAFPLELANGRPVPPLADEAVEVLAREPAFGTRPWSGEHGDWPGSFLDALAAVQAAKEERAGGLPASEALDWALRRALFAQSRPIGTPGEVLAVAREVPELDVDALEGQLDAGRDAVRRDWELTGELRIEGSPHVRLSDGSAVFNPGIGDDGSDDPGVWDELLRRALAPEG